MGRKGFTLMEVMVAIVVFSIIMLVVFSSFHAFISSADSIKSSINEYERVRVALERMCEDMKLIHMVQPPRYMIPEFDAPPDPFGMAGSQTSVGGSLFSRVAFASLARVILDSKAVRHISTIIYYVRQNQDNSFDLCRSDQLPGIAEQVNPCRDPILLKNIQVFQINYVDAQGNTKNNWDSDSSDVDYAMPVRLDIRLKLAGNDTAGVFETAVFLPVNRGPLE
ncbi:MAG: prepilin-type N-terminal cleavage/methylation domain-containing protein [Pseudomonadota bacterium]